MVRRILKIFVWILISSVLLTGAYFVIFNTNILKITNISYNLNENTDIDPYIDVKIGDFFWTVDEDKVSSKIKENPFVKEAVVKIDYPNKVIIEIDYREHFLSAVYVDLILSLDEDLVVLEVLKEIRSGFYVNGFSFDSFSAGDTIKVDRIYILRNIVNLIRWFEENSIVPEQEIVVTKSGILFKVSGINVVFSVNVTEERFFDFLSIYYSLVQEGINFGTIDVSNEGLNLYRPFGDE